MAEAIEPWDLVPSARQRELVESERIASPQTPLLDGLGFWNDTSVPREMDRQAAEARVRARVNREGVKLDGYIR
jgi:hypothetical protein